MMLRCLGIVFLLLGSIYGSAQDKKAAKILDRITEMYEEASSITLDFDLTIQYPEEDAVTYPSTVVESNGKWLFSNDQQKIYQDGSDIWVYIPSQNEVQINDYDPEESGDYFVSPVGIVQQYKDGGHKYRISDKNKEITFIELVPTDEFSEYAKIKIATSNKTGHIQEIEVINKDGSRATIIISHLKTDIVYASDYFDFQVDDYPDIIVEDLRLDN